MTIEENDLDLIANQIVKVFGKIFATRPYIAIIDATGKIRHIDEPLSSQHLAFIEDFVKTNFKYMKVGEYSVPLGSINLAFFKISNKAIITIYTEKGFTGQLLAFKTRMHEWSGKIDDVLGEVEVPTKIDLKRLETIESSPPEVSASAAEEEKRGTTAKKVPILTKELTGKEKFSLESASILQFCDGNRSIEEITEMTNLPKVKVNQILGELKMKGWVKFKRVLS